MIRFRTATGCSGWGQLLSQCLGQYSVNCKGLMSSVSFSWDCLVIVLSWRSHGTLAECRCHDVTSVPLTGAQNEDTAKYNLSEWQQFSKIHFSWALNIQRLLLFLSQPTDMNVGDLALQSLSETTPCLYVYACNEMMPSCATAVQRFTDVAFLWGWGERWETNQ